MTINLSKAQQLLQQLYDELTRQITDQDPKENPRLLVWANRPFDPSEPQVTFDLSNDVYGDQEIKVKGINLQDCVDEYLRRKGFQASQRLQLAPPVEAESE